MSRTLSFSSSWGLGPFPTGNPWLKPKASPSQSRTVSEAQKHVLVVLAEDDSCSLQSYREDMQQCVQTIISGCSLDQDSSKHQLMHLVFGDNIQQCHDFKPLDQCKPEDYVSHNKTGRSTVLQDAILYAVNSLVAKADYMKDDDVSGIVILYRKAYLCRRFIPIGVIL